MSLLQDCGRDMELQLQLSVAMTMMLSADGQMCTTKKRQAAEQLFIFPKAAREQQRKAQKEMKELKGKANTFCKAEIYWKPCKPWLIFCFSLCQFPIITLLLLYFYCLLSQALCQFGLCKQLHYELLISLLVYQKGAIFYFYSSICSKGSKNISWGNTKLCSKSNLFVYGRQKLDCMCF